MPLGSWGRRDGLAPLSLPSVSVFMGCCVWEDQVEAGLMARACDLGQNSRNVEEAWGGFREQAS